MIAPHYFIHIDGFKIPVELMEEVVNVTYTDAITGSNVIDLTIKDPDSLIVDSNLLQDGNTIELYMGYGTTNVFMNRCKIVESNPEFGSAVSQITVRGYDKLHDLAANRKDRKKKRFSRKHLGKVKGLGTPKKKPRKKKKDEAAIKGKRGRAYKNMKDSDIVKTIFRKHSLIPDIDKFGSRKSRIQIQSVTDYQLLEKLAVINSCFFWVSYNRSKNKWVGHFKKRSTLPARVPVIHTIGDDFPTIVKFVPHKITKDQKTDIVLLAMDQVKKVPIYHRIDLKDIKRKESGKKFDGTVTKDIEQLVDGSRLVFEAFGRSVEIVTNIRFKNKKEAKEWAEAYARKNADAFIKATAKVVGDPYLRARDLMFIAGGSVKYSGMYEIEKVTHTMDSGQAYYCTLELRKLVKPLGIFEKYAKVKRRKLPRNLLALDTHEWRAPGQNYTPRGFNSELYNRRDTIHRLTAPPVKEFMQYLGRS